MKSLCIVFIPIGVQPDPTDVNSIDFDWLYEIAIKPAIEDAGLEPVRTNEYTIDGIIHQATYEHLLLYDYAIVDLTTANANVFYQLGVRHAIRPASTVTIFAHEQYIPFDTGVLQSLPYRLNKDNLFSNTMAGELRVALVRKLQELRKPVTKENSIDSRLFQLIGGWKSHDIAHTKTDVFREEVHYNDVMKQRLSEVREKAKNKKSRVDAGHLLEKIRTDIGPLDDAESGVIIDLMLTYRALSDWQGMINLHHEMPRVLAEQVMVQEQLGFALNRNAKNNPALRVTALEVLRKVEKKYGPNSETSSLIGRIHKDNWEESIKQHDNAMAEKHLNAAIEAYMRGFIADPRDAFPGINLVTLLDIRGDSESLKHRDRLIPVVRFAVTRRLQDTTVDYWDYATLLELAAIGNDPESANEYLGKAIASVRESWEPETTRNNLLLVFNVRSKRSQPTQWLANIIDALDEKQSSMS